MNNISQQVLENTKFNYKPIILRIYNSLDKDILDKLIIESKVLFKHDEIHAQLEELIKIRNPSIRIHKQDLDPYIIKHLKERKIEEYGVWVYYSWNQQLVHILDEEEFAEVRTNRNQYKITKEEKKVLSTKKIGIIGLSVGQSIALTLAMERSFGELRLADFDLLELSNLNRIRTSICNLGIPKVVVTAREILEIDPFLNVICYMDGITENNITAFLIQNGKLDLLVDECDSLDIKILARYKSRELKIPVIMDTSDRGMLDVERFDLTEGLPLLHGRIEDIQIEKLKDLTNEQKIPIMLQMLGSENISLRAKVSMLEVNQTINTWPQLASSVALGGAVGADVCRRILLNQFHDSGRYYIDIEEQISDKKIPIEFKPVNPNPYYPLSKIEMSSMVDECNLENDDTFIKLNNKVIEELVTVASLSPSTGNDQPWKWYYKNGVLYLFHDEFRSYSFGDFNKIASFITFGAAFENLYIHAVTLGIQPYYIFIPNKSNEKIVAAIRFKKIEENNTHNILSSLDKAIFKRHTNRNAYSKAPLHPNDVQHLTSITESIPNAQLQIFTKEEDLKAFAKIIGACDRIRLLNPQGHHDFVNREMRWTSEDAERTKDGIDVKTLGLENSQIAALKVIKNEDVIKSVKEFGGGRAIDMLAFRTISTASAICLISLPKYELKNFFEGGRSMERFWLAATNLNLSIYPIISPLYLFPRVLHGNNEGLDNESSKEIEIIRALFASITKLKDNNAEVFLAKIGTADEPLLKSYRIPVNEILIIEN